MIRCGRAQPGRADATGAIPHALPSFCRTCFLCQRVLVLTDRYKVLLTAAGTLTGTDTATQGVGNGLVVLELEARLNVFNEAVEILERQIARWS